MKHLFFTLIIAALFAACNGPDERDIKNGCPVLHYLQANDQEQALLSDNGFDIGDVIEWQNLTAQQKTAFLNYGLDSTRCYAIEP